MENGILLSVEYLDDATDDQLEKAVIKILADVDVDMEASDITTCHRFRRLGRK